MFKLGVLNIKYPAVPAPLASITDIVFRHLLDDIGYTGFMVTEMISAEGLRRHHAKTLDMLRSTNFKTPQLIQLFGSEPDPFIDAIKYIENETNFKGIDINMGCPAVKVIKKGAGSALLKNPLKVAEIVGAVKRTAQLPVSVKIRLGYNDINVIDIIKILIAEGVDAVTVHFRTRSNTYSDPAQWQYGPIIKKEMKNILLIGNGDIKTAEDAREKLKIADAVMIGRGAVINPLIFQEIAGIKNQEINLKWVFERLLRLIEYHYSPQFHLARLKAYSRFLFSNRKNSKHIRQKIYTSKTFTEASQYISEFEFPG